MKYEDAFKRLNLRQKICFFPGLLFYAAPIGWIIFGIVHLHALRITELLEQGYTPRQVQAFTQHECIDTIMR